MTVRFSEDLARELEVVARFTGCTVTEIVRAAIETMIAEERELPEFRDGVRRLSAENGLRLARMTEKRR